MYFLFILYIKMIMDCIYIYIIFIVFLFLNNEETKDSDASELFILEEFAQEELAAGD